MGNTETVHSTPNRKNCKRKIVYQNSPLFKSTFKISKKKLVRTSTKDEFFNTDLIKNMKIFLNVKMFLIFLPNRQNLASFSEFSLPD